MHEMAHEYSTQTRHPLMLEVFEAMFRNSITDSHVEFNVIAKHLNERGFNEGYRNDYNDKYKQFTTKGVKSNEPHPLYECEWNI